MNDNIKRGKCECDCGQYICGVIVIPIIGVGIGVITGISTTAIMLGISGSYFTFGLCYFYESYTLNQSDKQKEQDKLIEVAIPV